MSPWGIAILAVVTGLIILTDKLGSVGNAFKALGIFVLRILAFVGDVIWSSLISPIKIFLEGINLIIKGLHKLGLANNIKVFDTSKLDLNLGKKVDKMRDDLIAESLNIKKEDNKDSKNFMKKITGFSLDDFSSGDLDNVETKLNNKVFDSNLPDLKDNSDLVQQLDKENLDAQKITNGILLDSYDVDKNISTTLDDIRDALIKSLNTTGDMKTYENVIKEPLSSTVK